VYEGGLSVGVSREAAAIHAQELAVLGDGADVRIEGRAPRTRAILVAGRPLREPVARYGPFVMNTREELHQAFADFQAGRF
jgi:redox-sensitive bicupin YhaK (pirin superfamily)